MVGSLSALNAVAGAASADLPLLVIVGSPNNNDEMRSHIVHHTTGSTDLSHSARCYSPIVAKALSVHQLNEASSKIDEAFHLCAALRKPVYLEISCNLTTQNIPVPVPVSSTYFAPKLWSDDAALTSAIEAIQGRIHAASKVVLVAGSKLRSAQATEDFAALAVALECGVAVMPDAKGLFSERHPQYMGCYWGGVSTRYVQNIVESADLVLVCGGVMTDYTTVGWTTLLAEQKTVILGAKHCEVSGQRYPHVHLKHVLGGLVGAVTSKPESLQSFRRYVPVTVESASEVTAAKEQSPEAPLSLRFLLQHLQSVVAQHTSSVVVETGDAWFLGQKLKLPDGVKYLVQMQYGSCGWALGASLGVSLAQKNTTNGDGATETEGPAKRVLSLIGDGSFQFSAQELSTLIRQNADVTIILLNNRTYTIEVQIHDGPYNQIPHWRYAELVDIFRGDNTGVSAEGVRVETNGDLVQALECACDPERRGVMLIECCLSKDDCTSSLLEWGSRVSAANMAT